jgi:non-specific serine/threonine protein kinase
MLETIREFGLDRLRESGEEAEIRRRHAAWYGALAEEAWQRLYHQPVDTAFLDQVDAEHDDIRAALAWLEQTDELLGLLTLAGAIGPLWYFRSHRSEGLGWLLRGLSRLPDPRVPPAIEARAVHMSGSLAEGSPDALDRLEQSARIWEGLGDRWGVAASGYEIAKLSNGLGDHRRAAAYAQAAIPVFQEFGNTEWQADAIAQLGVAAFGEGRVEEAFAQIERALAMGRQIEDWYDIGLALSLLGFIATQSGDPPRAAAAYRESLDAWTRIGNKEGMTRALAGIAALAATWDRHDLAARLFGAADNLAAAIGYHLALPQREFVERARAATRGALGEPAFDDAYAIGRTASLGSSIAEAAEYLENPLPGTAAKRPGVPRPASAEDVGLTPRELEVLRLLAEGKTDREIGELLSISRATAARHIANIFGKLDVSSRTAAAAYAFRQGLI